MEITTLSPNLKEYNVEKYLINDTYIMEVNLTIFKGYRVCLRTKGDLSYIFNWCAGKRTTDKDYLKITMLNIIEADDIDLFPLCSRIKPYFVDPDFSKLIEPYFLINLKT